MGEAPGVDVEQASREELLAVIARQQEKIAALEEQLAKLTARLRGAAGRAFRA